jgi:hypothetical protein
MSWSDAGAFVWHTDAIDPAVLGQELRTHGFGWAAIFVQDGATASAPDPAWIDRFRRASGLPLGGWGVLRSDPVREAEIAHGLIRRYGLDFYIADAEAEYGYTAANGPSGARYARSQSFVNQFRSLEPDLPAALASYCRPDQHDLDWKTWNQASFDFLPEAYVNVLGASVDPAVCVKAASGYFPTSHIHPIIGMYQGSLGLGSATTYAHLLHTAGTSGFSVYLAEQGMTNSKWATLGAAITNLHIATPPQQQTR